MNIGCVVYKKNVDSGDLSANWHFAVNNKKIKGTGEATGTPGKSYAGEYKITYYNEKGMNDGTYDLHIKGEGGFYVLRWFRHDELKYIGTGMIYNGSLIAGWKSANTTDYTEDSRR